MYIITAITTNYNNYNQMCFDIDEKPQFNHTSIMLRSQKILYAIII